VSPLVIDASVAIKWVVEEAGTSEALGLRGRYRLLAPDLLVAECANILWKKVSRKELSSGEALLAARLLQAADLELRPGRPLLLAATELAVELDHPAYDCLYLAVAVEIDCRLVTMDERLLRKLGRKPHAQLEGRVASLAEFAA